MKGKKVVTDAAAGAQTYLNETNNLCRGLHCHTCDMRGLCFMICKNLEKYNIIYVKPLSQ